MRHDGRKKFYQFKGDCKVSKAYLLCSPLKTKGYSSFSGRTINLLGVWIPLSDLCRGKDYREGGSFPAAPYFWIIRTISNMFVDLVCWVHQTALFAIIKLHNTYCIWFYLGRTNVWLCFRGQPTRVHILTQSWFQENNGRLRNIEYCKLLKFLSSCSWIKEF